MNYRKISLVFAALVASSGASASIKGTMAAGIGGQELCIVENSRVEEKFRDLMLRVINARGYPTRFVHASADCPVTMSFAANYARTRMGMYKVLKTSAFTVYRNSQSIAAVNYRYSHGPTGNGTVEEVVTEMVATLLPPGR